MQSLPVELLPLDASSLAARAATDVNARAALAALSVVSVQVSSTVASQFTLYDEVTGQGEITSQWLQDRSSMLDTYVRARANNNTFYTDTSSNNTLR